ncbi:hypothetical protein DFH29DRAFT_886166 [Suillus ampliporus]|nr:hypothetical protein DFH29DRAFT_886166 [Suillus ampliporus]
MKHDLVYRTGVTVFKVLDVILSIILAFFLWQNKTGVDHLDRALLRFFAVATESSLAIVASANRLVFVFLLQTGKLYTLSILRTLNAKVKLRERMKSDDLARGSLGNWSWRQAEVDHEMSAAHLRSSTGFGTATRGHPSSIPVGPSETSVADSRMSMLSQHLGAPMPIHSNSPTHV